MEEIKTLLNVMVNTMLTPEDTNAIDQWRADGRHEDVALLFKCRYYDLDKEMRVNALKEVLKRKYINYYNTLIDTENVEELLPTLRKIKELEKSNDSVTNSNIMFITLAPPDNEININNFVKKTLEICGFKYIQKYLFVIEQRFNGEPNDKYKKIGDGMHIHLMIDKGNHKPSDVKRDIKRKFAGYTMNMDFSFRRERDILKTQEYMVGSKKDTDKQIKQEQDKIWRKTVEIKDYYGCLWDS